MKSSDYYAPPTSRPLTLLVAPLLFAALLAAAHRSGGFLLFHTLAELLSAHPGVAKFYAAIGYRLLVIGDRSAAARRRRRQEALAANGVEG